ncbi:MAG: serine/threonine-protein kinase [Holophagae bacterium]|jgi:serine/threonine-protein kinase
MIESLGSLESKYEIIENIGEGGMGSVFKVRHRILDEIRVVKMMRSHLVHEEESKERFFREARIAAKARHRNIAQIFDFSVDEGVAFLIMEYIDGVTLQNALADHGPMSIPLALEVAQQSLHALAFVHRLGIIHRDISPDNLMLTADSDGNAMIKLIDLGLAKFTEADSVLTREGLFLGKLRYASPEQFQTLQGAELGPWSDVYSFGLVLYELLTGVYPIRGRNLAELMVGHVSEPPLSFDESDPKGEIPDALRQVVMRSLAKQPEARFRDGKDFRDHIQALQKQFPCGRAEKDEAAIKRQRKRPHRAAGPNRTSDQDRLARAFGADESSAGRASAPFPEHSDADSAATELRPTGQERPIEAPSSPPQPAPPPARTPPEPMRPRDPDSEPGVGSGAEPPTIPFKAQKADRLTPPEAPPRPAHSAAVDTTSEVAEPSAATPTSKRRDKLLAAVVGLVVVIAVVVLLSRIIPLTSTRDAGSPAGATGTVVVNAAPWAKVVEVRTADGEPVEHGGGAYTPTVLSLAPGEYQILLRNDRFGERTVSVTVTAGETAAEWIPMGEVDASGLLESLGLQP